MSIDASAVARVVGVEAVFKNLQQSNTFLLPQRVAVLAQGNTAATYPTDKFRATDAATVGRKVGFGSPAHLAAKELFPVSKDGVGTVPVTFFPLEDDPSGTTASGTITPTGTQSSRKVYRVKVSEISTAPIVLEKDDAVADAVSKFVAAINAVLDMPVIATDNATTVGIDAKWAGASGNNLHVEIVGEEDGITFAITQPTGGATDPDVTAALDKIGDVWETLIVNAAPGANGENVSILQTRGEARWNDPQPKPFVAFMGITDTAVPLAVSSGREDDRVNAVVAVPGSKELPSNIAARAVAKIARVANNNPPTDYGSQRLTGIVPGDDSGQWDYATRDQAVKAGISTTIVRDGVVHLQDVVTFYRPDGEPVPAYRYVVDIVKIQNILFNIGLLFNTPQWDGAPLIPDGQPTTNPNARKPKAARAAVNGMIDGLGLEAIISDPESAKEKTTAQIDGSNPKRLNVSTTLAISGNANQTDVTLNWGFFFGTPALV